MLKKVFAIQDNDKSGVLTFSEMIIYTVDPNQIREKFSSMDKNYDGQVSLEEFSSLMSEKDATVLYNWLKRNDKVIKIIKNNWIKSVDTTNPESKITLKTPLLQDEVFRLLLHLPLSRYELSELHKYLHDNKLLRENNFIYFGELLSLVCCWFSK